MVQRPPPPKFPKTLARGARGRMRAHGIYGGEPGGQAGRPGRHHQRTTKRQVHPLRRPRHRAVPKECPLLHAPQPPPRRLLPRPRPHQAITIIDTSSTSSSYPILRFGMSLCVCPCDCSPEQKPKMATESQEASAVVLTYACDHPATLERLSSFCLPELQRLQLPSMCAQWAFKLIPWRLYYSAPLGTTKGISTDRWDIGRFIELELASGSVGEDQRIILESFAPAYRAVYGLSKPLLPCCPIVV